jgi:hypothetical protein
MGRYSFTGCPEESTRKHCPLLVIQPSQERLKPALKRYGEGENT